MYDSWIEYWMLKGENDQRKKISPDNVISRLNFEENFFANKYLFFYRLGRAKELFANNPSRLKLIDEIYDFFCKNHFPQGRIYFSTLNHYSHRLIKKVFFELGYKVQNKPSCKKFYATPISK